MSEAGRVLSCRMNKCALSSDTGFVLYENSLVFVITTLTDSFIHRLLVTHLASARTVVAHALSKTNFYFLVVRRNKVHLFIYFFPLHSCLLSVPPHPHVRP